MPGKGKATKSEVGEGGKSSTNTTSKVGSTNYSSTKKLQQLKVEKKLDLDEIAVACLEIEQEMAKQESRPKNRRKQEAKLKNGLEKKLARENKNTSKVNKKEVEEEELQGEGVQQLSEINMTRESSAEATRLTELIRISVEVRKKIFALHWTQSDSTESLDIAGRYTMRELRKNEREEKI